MSQPNKTFNKHTFFFLNLLFEIKVMLTQPVEHQLSLLAILTICILHLKENKDNEK